MATLGPDLWRYNLTRVVVVDVSDDYRLMQPPMPASCYPVIGEVYVPQYQLTGLNRMPLAEGYLYDWHETEVTTTDGTEESTWYVGVVCESLLLEPPAPTSN